MIPTPKKPIKHIEVHVSENKGIKLGDRIIGDWLLTWGWTLMDRNTEKKTTETEKKFSNAITNYLHISGERCSLMTLRF